VGYFWTTYKDYERSETNYFGTTLPGSDTYSRTNKVFGAGIDFKF
jgi:long-chain fatty acid transport protein